MYFYEILQSIMKEKNLSIPAVARLSGLPDSTIRSIISRKNRTVALEVAFKLAKGLDVSLEELNGEQGIVPVDISSTVQKTPGKSREPDGKLGISLVRKKLLKEVEELDEGKLNAVATFIKYLNEEK